MLKIILSLWALLLGIGLLMVGNGVQGTLLGVRGDIEGFSTFQMSVVMAGYFAGFLGGSRAAPDMIRRVGHVRVFAALGSLVSAALILFPAITDPWAWTMLRVLVGFCFSGLYVTAESWLNNASSNETRGQTLSAYMIVQMLGIVAAQALVGLGDPGGWILFIVPSVLVSVAFTPILLSISPTPPYDSTKPLPLTALYRVSPLGCVGMFLLGGVFAAQFGMSAVFGTVAGLSVAHISIFVSTFFIGALALQYPLGWLSDRMDRRVLIIGAAGLGALAALLGAMFSGNFAVLLVSGFLVGGMSNPLYSLLLAYTNDFLDLEDMAAASGGLIFINGLGAIAGPLITGWMLDMFGPSGFFLFILALLGAIMAYGVWRMTQRAAPAVDDTGAYAPVAQGSSAVIVDAAWEYAADAAAEEEEGD
ncbi:MFS transporter [Pseudaestuariivita atlantica]|uniref:Major facilitator transporter n=1 Tax=Pseudaestuariivita atlantica TaxID=1317121 RepID=A0A0L1JUT3_9RHOB|nr:MFS transporter [Pseudaestuariivita atlantica]KNG95515.1 major facilitator transporter [Pseudaestuariivita atlantica]